MNNLAQQFHQDGYVIVPNLIPDSICDFLRQYAENLVQTANLDDIKSLFASRENGYINGRYFFESGHEVRFYLDQNALDESGDFNVEKKYVVNKLGHGLHEADPVFYCFSQQYAIIHLLDQLGVQQPTLLQSMYLFKQPFIGDEVGCHQDETFITPTSGFLVGLWFALEDATIENGCLWTIPKAHQSALKRKMIRTMAGELRIEEYDTTPWPQQDMVPLEVKKGSVIALHGLLPHMSQANRSNKSRHAYTLHVISKTQQLAVGNWLSPDGAERFIQI